MVDPAPRRAREHADGPGRTENVRIADVAQRLGVTPRHLRRAFVEHVGVGPKDFARAVRLHRVLETAARSPDWGRIAADAGYYDQAHLIADFRELVGVTPRAFAKGSTHRDEAGLPKSEWPSVRVRSTIPG